MKNKSALILLSLSVILCSLEVTAKGQIARSQMRDKSNLRNIIQRWAVAKANYLRAFYPGLINEIRISEEAIEELVQVYEYNSTFVDDRTLLLDEFSRSRGNADYETFSSRIALSI